MWPRSPNRTPITIRARTILIATRRDLTRTPAGRTAAAPEIREDGSRMKPRAGSRSSSGTEINNWRQYDDIFRIGSKFHHQHFGSGGGKNGDRRDGSPRQPGYFPPTAGSAAQESGSTAAAGRLGLRGAPRAIQQPGSSHRRV